MLDYLLHVSSEALFMPIFAIESYALALNWTRVVLFRREIGYRVNCKRTVWNNHTILPGGLIKG